MRYLRFTCDALESLPYWRERGHFAMQINQACFSKTDTLKLIPKLKEAAFKRLAENGLIRFQFSGAHRRLSTLSIIRLAIMQEAVVFGFRWPAAKQLADKLEPRILELWAGLPILSEDRSRTVFRLSNDDETDMPLLYAMFEIDLLVANIVARIQHHVAASNRKRHQAAILPMEDDKNRLTVRASICCRAKRGYTHQT